MSTEDPFLKVSERAARDTPPGTLKPRLREILRCTACRSSNFEWTDRLATCRVCGGEFLITRNGAVVTSGLSVPDEPDRGHQSWAVPAPFRDWIHSGLEVLNIGAGNQPDTPRSCIELEASEFASSDVVGDAHDLPFVDESFDYVIAMNVFEHLRDPARAAGEIHRVLKPGGRVGIHTAFIQPLHEAPNHFYNATEYGVREWFHLFDIETVDVSPNFLPDVALQYLLAVLAHDVSVELGPNARSTFELATVGEFIRLWEGSVTESTGARILRSLPPHVAARFSAGFELIAAKSMQFVVGGRIEAESPDLPAPKPRSTGSLEPEGRPLENSSCDFEDPQRLRELLREARLAASESRLELDRLRREVDYYYRNFAEHSTVAELLARVHQLEEDSAALAAARARVSYLEGSRSWRLTRPLRLLLTALR